MSLRFFELHLYSGIEIAKKSTCSSAKVLSVDNQKQKKDTYNTSPSTSNDVKILPKINIIAGFLS